MGRGTDSFCQVMAVIQASLLFEACSKGLGTSIDLLVQSKVNSVQNVRRFPVDQAPSPARSGS